MFCDGSILTITMTSGHLLDFCCSAFCVKVKNQGSLYSVCVCVVQGRAGKLKEVRMTKDKQVKKDYELKIKEEKLLEAKPPNPK